MSKRLEQKVIVVTGASGRLGSRIVQRFAEEGATIAAVIREKEKAHTIPFPEHAEGWAFIGDVTDEAVVQACFEQIGNQVGHINALIHAVGCWEGQPFLETSLDDWNRLMTCNLTSAFLCFREAARLMQEGSGKLIGFASRQGADGAPAEQGSYAAAKSGLIRLVEAVAAEYVDKNISTYAIAPSTILFDEAEGQSGVSVDDVAELCVYLCSDTADALSGTTIRAFGNGG